MRLEFTSDLNDPNCKTITIEYANLEDLEKLAHLVLRDEDNEYFLFNAIGGEVTLTYGDGKKEYWTYKEGKQCAVDLDQGLKSLRMFARGEPGWKAGIKWYFFQDQPGKGCLGMVLLALLGLADQGPW